MVDYVIVTGDVEAVADDQYHGLPPENGAVGNENDLEDDDNGEEEAVAGQRVPVDLHHLIHSFIHSFTYSLIG